VAEEQGQEKTEEPTARKLTQARERGELPRSPDFGGAMEVLVICLLMFFIGAEIVDGFSEMLKNGLTFDRSDLDDVENLPLVAGARLFEGLWAVKWILLASIIVALLASTLNGGFNFSGKAAAPKLSKLNPLSGLKRMFGAQAWIGLLRNLLKFFAIAAVLGFVLWTRRAEMIAMSRDSLEMMIASGASLALVTFTLVSVAVAAIALLDCHISDGVICDVCG